MKKVMLFAGTRPEAIKVAPVYLAFKHNYPQIKTLLCTTGQHKEMLNQALADFLITADISLDVMTHNQGLSYLSSKLYESIDNILTREQPDVILVQGDTTTVQIAATVAFYHNIAVGHIEAGLRSHNLKSPFPEEFNRRLTALATTWHFPPTQAAKQNLLDEKFEEENILVTGNTVIDALLYMSKEVKNNPPKLPVSIEIAINSNKPIILITGHRRESFGDGFKNICEAISFLAQKYPDVYFIYPVHLNPNVQEIVHKKLSGIPNILLEKPLSYKPFIRLMNSCHFILTDSGGIQEEGPSLKKPVLIMRSVTERPEGVEVGVNRLIGTKSSDIIKEVSFLLDNDTEYTLMSSIDNPYGDGTAAIKIADFINKKL